MVILAAILLFVNGAFKVMTSQFQNSDFISDIFNKPIDWFSSLVTAIESFLSSSHAVHTIAFMFVAIFVVTLFFIGLFCVFRLFSFFFRRNPSARNSSAPRAEDASEADNSEDPAFEEALETELENELSKSQEIPEKGSVKEPFNEKASALFQEINVSRVEDYHDFPKKVKESPLVDLDWKNSRKNQQVSPSLSSSSSPQAIDLRKNLQNLISMIVNMIGRHVDELKIAQALMYRCKEDLSEESILQTVHSIKEFLSLCSQNAFDRVRKLKDLPSDEDCILRLISGDTSYAMALLEALMDDKITQAVSTKNMVQRNALFKQASDYACYFGTLAEINDINLASASFELAVEMNPDNPVAWSRCADLYKQLGFEDKANWAYRNVLKLSNQTSYQPQEANARKVLSQYFYANGDSIQAGEFYQQSKSFYDAIGINRPLDRKELEIIELIDRTETNKILQSVLDKKKNHLSL